MNTPRPLPFRAALEAHDSCAFSVRPRLALRSSAAVADGARAAGAQPALWWAPLDVSPATLRELSACLTEADRQQADALRRPRDRARFLAARGWLRRLLARQLDCAPQELNIVRGPHGKPAIASCALRFNASRSAGVALYATSWGMEVGVDIEEVRESADVDAIAARFFSRSEQRELAPLPAATRRQASFRCWTRKEAYLKGIGVGLTVALERIEVGTRGRQPATLSGWSVHHVHVAPGYAAAVATPSPVAWSPQRPRRLGTAGSTPVGSTTVIV
jgi:4'-phosphopantetheinyl transferase